MIKPIKALASFNAIPDTFVTIDTETTDLFDDNGDAPGILSIGACLVVDNNVVDRFSVKAQPDRPINPEATRVNGITDSMAKSFPPLHDVWSGFKDYADNQFLVAHSMVFDWEVLSQNAHRHDVPMPSPTGLFCTLKGSHLYGNLFLKPSKHGPSLDRLTEHFGTHDGRSQIDDRHDAGVDAEQLAYLVLYIKRLLQEG